MNNTNQNPGEPNMGSQVQSSVSDELKELVNYMKKSEHDLVFTFSQFFSNHKLSNEAEIALYGEILGVNLHFASFKECYEVHKSLGDVRPDYEYGEYDYFFPEECKLQCSKEQFLLRKLAYATYITSSIKVGVWAFEQVLPLGWDDYANFRDDIPNLNYLFEKDDVIEAINKIIKLLP